MLSVILYLVYLFFIKVLDNGLGTAKTLLIQRNKSFLAALSLALSTFLYMLVTKDVVQSDSLTSLIIVSLASGLGCWLAVILGNRFSKERTYVNVIMSDDLEAMKALRDFLASHKVTNTATDSYALDWSHKTITITAYAETKEQSRLIDEYIANSPIKFRRLVDGTRVRPKKKKRGKLAQLGSRVTQNT